MFIPLFKKGKKDHPGNSRVVPLVGKQLEMILREKIYLLLEESGLIRNRQRGTGNPGSSLAFGTVCGVCIFPVKACIFPSCSVFHPHTNGLIS